MSQLLSVDEVAARLSCHPHTVRRWIWSHKLKAVKVGDLVRVPEDEVVRMMRPAAGTTPKSPKGPTAMLRLMRELSDQIDPATVESVERAIKKAEQPADWSDPLA